MKRRRILVVDDESSILHSTAAILRDLGYDVATCGNASSILSCIEAERPDVILQDVRMPGLDLESVVLEIRSRWGSIPIVLFTAGMDAEEVAARVQANGVVEKPFRPDELASALRSVANA